MRGKYTRFLTFLVAFSMILSMHVSFAEPDSEEFGGNDNYSYKTEGNPPPGSTWYFDVDGNATSDTNSIYWVEFTVSSDGKYLSYETNNISLELVSVKGSDGYIVYTNLGDSESGLTAPKNPSGNPAGISHYSFELDEILIPKGDIIISKTLLDQQGKEVIDDDTQFDFIIHMYDDNSDEWKVIQDSPVSLKGGESETLNGLPIGKYKITEDGLPSGYWIHEDTDNPQELTLVSDGDSKDANFTNVVEDITTPEGSLKITKEVVDDQGNELATDSTDFSFTIEIWDEDLEDWVVIDQSPLTLSGNDNDTITGLPMGEYKITETTVNGYVLLDDNGMTRTLENDGDEASVTFTNEKTEEAEETGRLIVHKRIMKENDSIVGNLDGGEFTVRLTGPNGYDEEKTINGPNENGEHVVFDNLPIGTYELEENDISHDGKSYDNPIFATSGNQNYTILNDFDGLVYSDKVTIEIEADYQVIMWLINPLSEEVPWEGSILVEKFFEGEGQYSKSGIEFTLVGPDEYEETLTTGEDGIVQFTELPEGTYTLSEDVPAGFTTSIPAGGLDIVLPDEAGEDYQATVDVTNTEIPEDWEGNIRVTKSFTDESDPEGIEFTLTGPGEFEQTKETDESGEVEFINLPEGEYTLTEDTPDGYISSLGVGGMDITLPGNYDWEDNDGYMFIDVTNRPEPEDWEGTIRVVKSVVDAEDDDPDLDGFTFRLYMVDDDDEDLVGTRTTGASGIVSFTGLAEGDYILYEENISNYTEGIGSNGMEITLSSEDADDDVLTIEVVNIRTRVRDRDPNPTPRPRSDPDPEPEVEAEVIIPDPEPIPEAAPEPEPEPEQEVEEVEEPTPLATLPATGASDPTVFAGFGAAFMALGLYLKKKRF